MFTEKAKKFIELEVTNIDGRADESLIVSEVGKKIHALELAIEISEHVGRLAGLKSAIIDQINYMAETNTIGSMEEFEKTAQFLELFIYLTDKEYYEKIEGKKKAEKISINSQAIPDYLLKLGIIENQKICGNLKCTYKNAASYNDYDDMLKVFGNLYYIRNEDAHAVRRLSITQAWQYVKELLILYLEVSGVFQKQLEEEVNRLNLNQKTNAAEYLETMKNKYKERESFNYIELDGIESNNKNSHAESLVKLITYKDNCKIKLIGNAGMGKTTTMEYLAYLDAININSNRTPIIIELKNISNDEKSIIGIIANKSHLDCSEEVVKRLLQNGYLNLYIDGINEINNEKLKSDIVSQINTLITTYPNIKFVITDRITNNITVTENVGVYVIEKLTDSQIKEFVDTNTNNKNLSEKINEKIDQSRELKEMVRVPFNLYKLIELMRNGVDIPSNLVEFEDYFTKMLIEREVKQKASKDAKNLTIFLNAIVGKGQEVYTREDIITIIGVTIKDRYLSEVSSDSILELFLDLNIMKEISFEKYKLTNDAIVRSISDKKEEENEVNLEGLI